MTEVELQGIMFMVYDYARISDGIDRAEGDVRRQQRAAMLEKANEIRAALAARVAPPPSPLGSHQEQK